jgi:hypothetical protein
MGLATKVCLEVVSARIPTDSCDRSFVFSVCSFVSIDGCKSVTSYLCRLLPGCNDFAKRSKVSTATSATTLGAASKMIMPTAIGSPVMVDASFRIFRKESNCLPILLFGQSVPEY